MSVKMRAIDRWQKAGETIPLPGKRREITVDFNVEQRTKLTVMQEGRQTLLRVLEPHECPATIKWVVEGDCVVVPESDGDVWWMSDDGDILAYPVLSESFTELEQRMEMTPEMEVTIYKAQVRAEQRKNEVLALQLARKQREEATAANADPETGEVNENEEPADPVSGAAEPEAAAGNSPAS